MRPPMEVQFNQGLEGLETLLQSLNEPVMIQDREFRCIYSNDLAAKMCGFSSAKEFKN